MAEKKTQSNETKQTQKKRDEYEIIVNVFRDKEDNLKKYVKGDNYPRPANKKISADRLKELATNENDSGSPVIRKK